MARKRFPPTDPREWINRAHSDLACAIAPIKEVYLEDLCFHAQQAVEKATKAVLIHRGITFPYVHDLAKLFTLLASAGVKVPKYVRRAIRLTRFAVETRYPGLTGPVTRREHRTAVKTAQAILKWAERKIGK